MTRRTDIRELDATGLPDGSYALRVTDGAFSGFGEAASGGGSALVKKTTLTSPAASLEFANIPPTYEHLRLVVTGRTTDAGASQRWLYASFNGDTSVTNYRANRPAASGGSMSVQDVDGGTSSRSIGLILTATSTAGYVGTVDLFLPNYTNTTWFKTSIARTVTMGGTSVQQFVAHTWKSTAAVTSISLTEETGATFAAGTTAWLYGVS